MYIKKNNLNLGQWLLSLRQSKECGTLEKMLLSDHSDAMRMPWGESPSLDQWKPHCQDLHWLKHNCKNSFNCWDHISHLYLVTKIMRGSHSLQSTAGELLTVHNYWTVFSGLWGSSSTGCKKKSNCMETYDEMLLFLDVYYLSKQLSLS